ncbi:16773_t:CDS:2, partial [Funneliformis geosporum]
EAQLDTAKTFREIGEMELAWLAQGNPASREGEMKFSLEAIFLAHDLEIGQFHDLAELLSAFQKVFALSAPEEAVINQSQQVVKSIIGERKEKLEDIKNKIKENDYSYYQKFTSAVEYFRHFDIEVGIRNALRDNDFSIVGYYTPRLNQVSNQQQEWVLENIHGKDYEKIFKEKAHRSNFANFIKSLDNNVELRGKIKSFATANYHGLTVAEINQILAKCGVSPAEQVKIDRVYTEYYNVCLEKTAEYQGHTKADTSLADLKKELVLAKVGKLEEKERLVGEEWRKLEAELAKPIVDEAKKAEIIKKIGEFPPYQLFPTSANIPGKLEKIEADYQAYKVEKDKLDR